MKKNWYVYFDKKSDLYFLRIYLNSKNVSMFFDVDIYDSVFTSIKEFENKFNVFCEVKNNEK